MPSERSQVDNNKGVTMELSREVEQWVIEFFAKNPRQGHIGQYVRYADNPVFWGLITFEHYESELVGVVVRPRCDDIQNVLIWLK
jgi:hypothetical protein